MDYLLATGIDGLVGSRFAELYNEKWDITNLSLATGVDITDQATVDEAVRQFAGEVVWHLAAFTDTAACAAQEGDESDLAYQVNVIGTRNIAQACAKYDKYLVHVSTDFVFDGEKDSPYTEEDTPAPIEWYGQTKWLAEQEVTNSQAKSVIMRIAFPYRASFLGKKDYVAKVREGLEAGTLHPQFADTLFTPTFVDDIAHAVQLLIEKRATGLYHVTGGRAYSNYEAAEVIAKAFHLDDSQIKPGSLAEYSQTPGARRFHKRLAISSAKLERDFDYNMATLEEGLATIVEQTDHTQLDTLL